MTSEETVDSVSALTKPLVQHHSQGFKRRIMLKAIAIEFAKTIIIPNVLLPKLEPEFNTS
ncbi:hypothetical protein GGH94_005580 [Coemansia aciculifera]|uniref:Uncharacterized protein n=1 Tax=Coemansia aciculifera TaxID=417176 RepID=A0A9W8ID96_9FUNG|nr:hypothetical protein GGH94_005580 [Coemansia aciculifera]KAJ2870520.1 hypothetical protein GGH93_005508 [Coemansia aciculifera]